jgi:hypothetical protein
MCFTEVGWEDVDCIHQIRNRVQWQTVQHENNLFSLKRWRIFWQAKWLITLSRKILLFLIKTRKDVFDILMAKVNVAYEEEQDTDFSPLVAEIWHFMFVYLLQIISATLICAADSSVQLYCLLKVKRKVPRQNLPYPFIWLLK